MALNIYMVNVVLTLVDRTTKGQSEESKQLRLMSVDRDPNNAGSDDIHIHLDSQRGEGFNKMLNINGAFLGQIQGQVRPTDRQYIYIHKYMYIYIAQTFKEGIMLCCTKT